MLNSEPKWDKYNLSDERTKNVKQYWSAKDTGGGTIAGNLVTETLENEKKTMQTPFDTTVYNTPVYGYFSI